MLKQPNFHKISLEMCSMRPISKYMLTSLWLSPLVRMSVGSLLALKTISKAPELQLQP